MKKDHNNWIARYRELLDSLNIGFVLVDMEENFIDVNETLLKMTGAQRSDLVGKNNRDFYSKDEFNWMRMIGQPLQKYRQYQFEYFIPTASGEKIPVLFNSSVNYSDDGNPESINVMITDIREQKKIQKELVDINKDLSENRDTLELEKKKLETILFGIGDSVSIFNPDGTLLMRNPKGDLIHGNSEIPCVTLEAGQSSEITLQLEGEERHFLCQVDEVRDRTGTTFAFIEILKDITEQKKYREQSHELRRMKRELKRYNLKVDMITNSSAMQNIFDLILRCSEVDSTVLILGETGVGKEMVARAIHENSGRRNKPFIAVNCAALPEPLLESELFGHKKGAFTGAILEREGLFREAEGGSLFLDEIGDISEAMQVKLLRSLQEREIRPLGSSKAYNINVRVITATNRDLKKMIEDGKFRKDLYYRVAVIPLQVPPLRDRKDDIQSLTIHFIQKHGRSARFKHFSLHRTTQQILLEYEWPGNVRELENAIEHALAMATGPIILPQDLPVHLHAKDNRQTNTVGNKFGEKKSFISEKDRIIDALKCFNGNRSLTARDLGISRTTLWRKIIEYKIAKT